MQVIPDGSDCNPILNSSFTMKPKVLTRLGKLISLSQQIFPVHSGPSRKKILCKSLSIFIIQACLCLSVLIFGFSQGVLAQSGFFEEDNFNFETDSVTGFSEDGRVKILLLTLLPKGMTETAAEEISRALQLNLFNTNHFTVVGPSEWNAQIEDRDPTLADCHDVACGVLIGKLFNADKVLVGNIRTQEFMNEDNQNELGFELSLRMVDVVTNITDFTDTVDFNDRDMHDRLFELAVRISENTLLRGFVISVKKPNISIDLGRAHGLQNGRQIVIFRQVSTQSNLEGQTLELATENIAIAEIVRVNDLSSDAIVKQRISAVTPGDQVQTYIDVAKQVHLITNTRRELDTQKRLRPRTRPLKLEPELVEEDTGKQRWAMRLSQAMGEENQWFYITAGGGAATLLLLSGNFNIFSGGLGSLMPWVAGGATVYAGMKYVGFRDKVSLLRQEGRNLGYLSFRPFQQVRKISNQETAFETENDPGWQLMWTQNF